MRQYSSLFTTVYDQPEPVGTMGLGTHYSVGRLFHEAERTVQTFAIIWDRDHDLRVIRVIDEAIALGKFAQTLFIGERRGKVTDLRALDIEDPVWNPGAWHTGPRLIVEGDVWSLSVGCLLNPNAAGTFTRLEPTGPECPMLGVEADPVRAMAYLNGIHALWNIGTVSATSMIGGTK